MGGFLGAMLTRGGERSWRISTIRPSAAARSWSGWKCTASQARPRLARAAQIIADAGAEPVPLPEG